MYDVQTLSCGDWEYRIGGFDELARAVEFVTARRTAELPVRWRVVQYDSATGPWRVVHEAPSPGR